MSSLDDAVNGVSAPVYLTSYEDVKEGFIDKYGEKRWIGKYIESLGLRTEGVKAENDKPYLAARRSIERFEKGKQKSSGYSQKAEQAGRQLPPIGVRPRKDSITISITGKQGRRTRHISATFRGSDAYDFVNDPSTWKVWHRYAVDANDGDPEGLADTFDGDDPDYAIDPTSISAA
jgi:hypothetical protein